MSKRITNQSKFSHRFKEFSYLVANKECMSPVSAVGISLG